MCPDRTLSQGVLTARRRRRHWDALGHRRRGTRLARSSGLRLRRRATRLRGGDSVGCDAVPELLDQLELSGTIRVPLQVAREVWRERRLCIAAPLRWTLLRIGVEACEERRVDRRVRTVGLAPSVEPRLAAVARRVAACGQAGLDARGHCPTAAKLPFVGACVAQEQRVAFRAATPSANSLKERTVLAQH